jgi:colanic acid biosynthesis glycosyl transferase WcaI
LSTKKQSVLLLNQCFYPDHVATAQYLTELAAELVERGHEVTVVASSRGYDDPEKRYPVHESWHGVTIHRIWTPGLGKTSKWRRLVDFGVFWLNAARILMFMKRHDVTVCLTSPPLISSLGTLAAVLKGGKVIPWIMDLNPDEAVAAGWLRQGSVPERIMSAVQNWSFSHAERILALDRFMAGRLERRGVPAERIYTAPPWSHDECVQYDAARRDAFRKQHGLNEKFVVMYSGNHSPCHPLDPVLNSALALRDDARLQFVFIGGGSEHGKVRRFKDEQGLNNITVLPYQPLTELSGSLSAADLHLVVMGEPFVGIVHPCKVYNILRLGIPLLALAPRPSHLSDLVEELGDSNYAHRLQGEDVDALVNHLRDRAGAGPLRAGEGSRRLAERFKMEVLRPALAGVIVSA